MECEIQEQIFARLCFIKRISWNGRDVESFFRMLRRRFIEKENETQKGKKK